MHGLNTLGIDSESPIIPKFTTMVCLKIRSVENIKICPSFGHFHDYVASIPKASLTSSYLFEPPHIMNRVFH